MYILGSEWMGWCWGRRGRGGVLFHEYKYDFYVRSSVLLCELG